MDYNTRRAWVHSQIQVEEPKRRRINTKGDINRNVSRYYKMPRSDGKNQLVCATFFRHTLGYKNNKFVTVALNVQPGSISTQADRRGTHEPAHKLTDDAVEIIKAHINSYHPAVSHYRREHAPLRKYLPPELSLVDMYNDFSQKHPGICKRERYRKTVKSMNIGFAKLGEEECETCVEHEVHKGTHHQDAFDTCEECLAWVKHMKQAEVARRWYRQDKEKPYNEEEALVSVDMQKIIMLPRMPGIKNCVFTRRLVQFHQTFAPLGGKSNCSDPAIGVIWDESVSGRNAEDVTSSYIHFIQHDKNRDNKLLVFYMDNCTSQNKNKT